MEKQMKKVLEIKSNIEKVSQEGNDIRFNVIRFLEFNNISGFVPRDFEILKENRYGVIGEGEISPNKFGIFSLLFEEANIKISFGGNEERCSLLIDYNYNHPGGGSNGKSFRLFSSDGGQTFN